MPTETNQASEKETLGKSPLGHGRLKRGKWYCECDKAARCITTKKNGPNKGRKFWRCPSDDDEQCAFFLWVDQEDEAKNWMKMSQLPPDPETPTRAGFNRHRPDSPQLLETPFTIAKRKMESKDTTSYDSRSANSNNPSLQPATATYSGPSSEEPRKAVRTSKISTPSQHFIDRLQSSTLPLPTPNSRDRISSRNTTASQLQILPESDTSPTPARFSKAAEPSSPEEQELTTTVLDLIRADHPNLKASTELQLRHVIGLTLDMGETKLRRCERTIAELQKKVDELETIVFHLT